MYKEFHHTDIYTYFSMLKLKLNHVSERGPGNEPTSIMTQFTYANMRHSNVFFMIIFLAIISNFKILINQ